MSTAFITLVISASLLIWIAISREVVKDKGYMEKNGLGVKVIFLMLVGTLLTIILTISLIQNLFS